MNRTTIVRHMVLVFSAAASIAGCGGSMTTNTNMDKTMYRGDLDPNYEIRLVHKSAKHQEGIKPENRYEEMEVVITPRNLGVKEYTLKRVDVTGWPSWSQFKYGEIQARTDAQRQRVWFVDTKNGKIVGTIDRQTGQASGPDETAPAWATADGGVPLGSVAE